MKISYFVMFGFVMLVLLILKSKFWYFEMFLMNHENLTVIVRNICVLTQLFMNLVEPSKQGPIIIWSLLPMYLNLIFHFDILVRHLHYWITM